MLRVFALALGLALLPAAYGAEIEGAYLPFGASLLELCSPHEAPGAEMAPEPTFGSLTGFIDFSPTDSILRFLDEYVGASLQSHELLAMLHALIQLEMPDLHFPSLLAMEEAAAAAESTR